MAITLHKHARLVCALSATCLAMTWASAREARAEAAPSSVYVKIAPDCASLAAEQMLLEEVRMRIPEPTKLKRSGALEAPWHLVWDWDAQDGCRLILSDNAPVIAIPLSVDAAPERIREAAVRVAWFIGTSQPRARVAPAPERPAEDPPESAGLDTNTTPAPAIEDELPTFPEPRSVEVLPEIPTPEVAPATSLRITPPTKESGSPLSLERSPHPSVLGSLSSTLSGWRSSSPALFGSLEDLGTRPPDANVLGRSLSLGGYAGVMMEGTSLDQSSAAIAAFEGGLVLGERFLLGASYRRLLNELVVDDNWRDNQDLGVLQFQQFGMTGDLLLRPEQFMSISLGSALLVGRAKAKRFEAGVPISASSSMLSTQLNAQAILEFTPWLETAIGLNYHFPLILTNSQVLTTEELTGMSLLLNVRLRIF